MSHGHLACNGQAANGSALQRGCMQFRPRVPMRPSVYRSTCETSLWRLCWVPPSAWTGKSQIQPDSALRMRAIQRTSYSLRRAALPRAAFTRGQVAYSMRQIKAATVDFSDPQPIVALLQSHAHLADPPPPQARTSARTQAA